MFMCTLDLSILSFITLYRFLSGLQLLYSCNDFSFMSINVILCYTKNVRLCFIHSSRKSLLIYIYIYIYFVIGILQFACIELVLCVSFHIRIETFEDFYQINCKVIPVGWVYAQCTEKHDKCIVFSFIPYKNGKDSSQL